MSNTAESILDQMRGMPRTEVDEVRKQIAAYMQFDAWGGDAAEEEVSSDARRVFRIVTEEMQAAGLADMREVHYHRLSNKRSFGQKAERLIAFLEEQHHDKRVQDGILRVGVQLLIKWLQRYAEEVGTFIVTTPIVVANINKVPARLDREFPGYGAVGMLHLLIPHP